MEKKKLVRSAPLSTVEEMEKAVEKLNEKRAAEPAPVAPASTVLEKPLYSYNIKLDDDTELRVKSHIGRTGQNMKGFFQMAIREYLEKHGA